MKPLHWILFSFGLAALVAIGGFIWKPGSKFKPSVVEESADERSESIQMAFAPSPSNAGTTDASADQELAGAANDFFRDLGIAFNRRDTKKIESLISGRAMFDLVDRSGFLKIHGIRERRQMRKGFEQGLAQSISNFSQMMAFDDFKVLRLEKIKEGEMIAYVRLWDDDLELYQKMRWWLLRNREGKWIAYDYEDFDMNLRTSTLLGVLLANNDFLTDKWVAPFKTLMTKLSAATSAGTINALLGLEDDIDKLLELDLPADLVPFCRILKTSILNTNEEFEEGLRQLQLIEDANASPPVLSYMRGACHLGLEKWDAAIKNFEEYGQLLGWDSDVREMLADCYYGKGDKKEAAKQAEEGLKDNPHSWGCLMTFSASVPEERRGEIEEHIKKTNNPEGAIDSVLDHLLAQDEIDTAREVYALLKKNHPKSDLIEYYEEEYEELQSAPASDSE